MDVIDFPNILYSQFDNTQDDPNYKCYIPQYDSHHQQDLVSSG